MVLGYILLPHTDKPITRGGNVLHRCSNMDLREAILPTGAIVHPYLDASTPLFHALASLREITDAASTAGAVSELLQAAGSACEILRPMLVAPGIHGQAAKAVAPRWRERHAAACCLVGRAELALGLRGCTTRALHALGECCPLPAHS